MSSTINFMDIKRQYLEHKDDLLNVIKQVCEETAFSGGKFADLFDIEFAKYCGVAFASGVNNGTNALHLAMLVLGIGPGDEVIIPSNTFIATAWGPTYAGATPVFVDCTKDTWNIDPKKIESAITNKTKAIIGVHLYGQPFDFDAVDAIAQKYNLFVVEDCAQAHGAKYKGRMVGGLGEIGCFSFYPGKNLGAYGEGGSVTSNKKEYIEQVNILKNHGSKQRYYHDTVGFNMRLEGIQGAVLSYKLKYLEQWSKRRQQIANIYLENIKNPKIKLQAQPKCMQSVFHLFVADVDNRESFIAHLKNDNINCGLHYPVPCHLQKVYKHLGYKVGDMPNAERLAAHCVSLPMFPELKEDEINRVIDTCNKY